MALKIGWILFFYQYGYAFDAELERKKIELSIKSELSQELSRVMQDSQYLLFVSVQGLEVVGTVENPLLPLPAQKAKSVERNFLPGFIPVPEENGLEDPVLPLQSVPAANASSSLRRYNPTNITVDVLHPAGVDPVMVSSLNRLITDRLQRTYKDALIQVRFERMGERVADGAKPLLPSLEVKSNESPADELASFLVRNFFPIILLLLLGLGLFLLTIILLFLLWSRSNGDGEKGRKVIVKNIRTRDAQSPVQNFWGSNSREKSEYGPTGKSPFIEKKVQSREIEKSFDELQEVQSEADRYEADFSKMFSQEPLISRRYVQELLGADKDLLLSTLNSSVFRGAIAMLMGVQKQEGVGWKNLLKNLSQEDRVQKRLEILKRQTKDIRAYQDLMHTQIGSGSLGKLSFLSAEELDGVLSDLDGGDVTQVLRHIRPELLRDFVKNMSESRRKDLLTRGLASVSPNLSDERKELLTKKMSNRIDDVEKTIFTSKASQEEILGYLLETSQDRRTLLNDIRRKDENLYRKYEHYGVGLEDFLRERDAGMVNMVLETLENEDLVVICLNLPSRERERIFSMLPPSRKSLIQNMVYASGGVGTDLKVFESARGKLVQSYRVRRKMNA